MAVDMDYGSESERGALEDHCYFPEWADLPPAEGGLHEVERNSYLAGGYAEEIGHRAKPASVREVSIPVEEDREWRVQIGCLHPGYPQCPRPLDRELPASGTKAGTDAGAKARRAEQPQRKPARFGVVLVGQEKGHGSRRRFWTPWLEFRIRRSRLPLG
jgi:hypothetical protein